MEPKHKFNIRRVIAEAIESKKIGDEKLTQDNWIELVQLYSVVAGLKPVQGNTVRVPKLRPRGRSPEAQFNKIIKREEQAKREALALALAEEKGEQK